MSDNMLFNLGFEEKKTGPVKCLGLEFENDEARRAHFTEELRKKLQDPEFRKIEGFPIGSDEDILNLSDPPYYTACPNPWLSDFVEYSMKSESETNGQTSYHREPFAADVSEGKYDPLYKIHSYPTKVPFRAIMRYILHFTNPGDIVYDGFCGTGMTGVAALMCGSASEFTQMEGKELFYKQGIRKAILCDLSINATHIAANYTKQVRSSSFQKYFSQFLKECETAVGWVYKSNDPQTNRSCDINYTVWSEVFICEHCSKEYSYWDSSVQYKPGDKLGVVDSSQTCPHCGAEATRRVLSNATETAFDPVLGRTIQVKKHVPVLLNCISGKRRFEKYPESTDADLLAKVHGELSRLASHVKTAPLMLQDSDIWGDLNKGSTTLELPMRIIFSQQEIYWLLLQ